jgi:hypothetical protein
MDDTLPILDPDDEPAALSAAPWPQAVMRPSAKLLDCEAWFCDERLIHRGCAGAAGGDLP